MSQSIQTQGLELTKINMVIIIIVVNESIN